MLGPNAQTAKSPRPELKIYLKISDEKHQSNNHVLDLVLVDLPRDVVELGVVHTHKGPSFRVACAVHDEE